MEKQIMRWSYWLGIASFLIALLWRGLNTLGVWLPGNSIPGRTILYMSFYKAGILFLLVAIATANYAWFNAHKP